MTKDTKVILIKSIKGCIESERNNLKVLKRVREKWKNREGDHRELLKLFDDVIEGTQEDINNMHKEIREIRR